MHKKDPEKVKEHQEEWNIIDDLENEIKKLKETMPELQENFKILIKKLNSIKRSTTMKKHVVLCVIYIDRFLKDCEQMNIEFSERIGEDIRINLEFEEFYCSPLHVASMCGFHNLIKVVLF